MQNSGNNSHPIERAGGLRNVAEDIKLPLMRIVTHIQLASSQAAHPDSDYIETTAVGALKLLDSYILSTQIYTGQQQLQLEPVSISATLYDTVQYLTKIAGLYNCKLEVIVPSKLGLAMASPVALQAALIGLGYSFLNTVQQESQHNSTILFSAKRTREGIEAGIFSPDFQLSSQELRLARNLTDAARHPLTSLKPGSSAGIIIADRLFQAMESEMQVVRRSNRTGLVANLLPSRQLALL